MRSILSTVLLVAACAQDAAPPTVTWRDAWTAWADGWCDDTARCSPDYFAQSFSGSEQCRAATLAQDCAETGLCDEPYPQEKVAALWDCEVRLADWPCGELLPPDSCFTALIP